MLQDSYKIFIRAIVMSIVIIEMVYLAVPFKIIPILVSTLNILSSAVFKDFNTPKRLSSDVKHFVI